MGTRMAPSYANLVLAYLEEKLYTKLKEKYGSEFGTYIEQNFLRYLDDCFIIWPHSKWDLDSFAKELNSLHPSLKFTQESRTSEIPFLDILVYLKDILVYTDLYYKPTDTHQYLHFNSCHPRHTKHNIPYSQARSLWTIIDDTEIRDRGPVINYREGGDGMKQEKKWAKAANAMTPDVEHVHIFMNHLLLTLLQQNESSI